MIVYNIHFLCVDSRRGKRTKPSDRREKQSSTSRPKTTVWQKKPSPKSPSVPSDSSTPASPPVTPTRVTPASAPAAPPQPVTQPVAQSSSVERLPKGESFSPLPPTYASEFPSRVVCLYILSIFKNISDFPRPSVICYAFHYFGDVVFYRRKCWYFLENFNVF